MSITHNTQEKGLFAKINKLFPREMIILFVVLILGLFLRIYNLTKESLWFDEGFAIRIASLGVIQIWEDEIHPPLFFILLHFWTNIWGISEFSTRFLSLLFGFFAIFMIYKVGKLIYSKEVGLISSLLLALSEFHIYYSQEVRMFSLLALLTLFSFYYFIKLLKERNRIILFGYILSSILLIYTEIYGVFIIIAQNIYIVTTFFLSKKVYKLNFKQWILLQTIIIISYTPYIVVLLSQISRKGIGIAEPSIYSIIQTFFTYSGGGWTVRGIIIGLLFLVLSLLAIVTIEKVKGRIDWKDFFKSIESYRWNIGLSNANTTYILLLWLLTPVLLPFIFSKFISIYKIRATIGASFAYYLLIAKGINNIKFNSVKRIRNIDFDYKCLKLVIIGIIIIISLFNVYSIYIRVDKEQWREAVNYVEKNAETGDLLLFSSGSMQENIFDYYSKRTDLDKRGFHSNINDENIKEIEPIVQGYNRVWVILSHYRDSKGLLKQTMSQSYDLLDYKLFKGIEIYLFIK